MCEWARSDRLAPPCPRRQVATLIGASPKEIVFTSGATESNNLAIKGVAEFFKARRNHVITTVTEHKCVLDSCRHLEHMQTGALAPPTDEGASKELTRTGASNSEFRVTYLPVAKSGLIDLKQLEAAITPQTCLVSIMAVNNEIGVIQPLAEIGKLCRKNGGEHISFTNCLLTCTKCFSTRMRLKLSGKSQLTSRR